VLLTDEEFVVVRVSVAMYLSVNSFLFIAIVTSINPVGVAVGVRVGVFVGVLVLVGVGVKVIPAVGVGVGVAVISA